ncbi:RNA-directed DNA polymerase, eukaryota, reverse transcriptase zinc-binding domain protein [Tanacetum coccineum]
MNSASTSSKKKQAELSRQEVSNSNLFDALNSVVNDDGLGTNEGNSKLAEKGVDSDMVSSAHEFSPVTSGLTEQDLAFCDMMDINLRGRSIRLVSLAGPAGDPGINEYVLSQLIIGWVVISDVIVESVTPSWDALLRRHIETMTPSPTAENIILRNVGVGVADCKVLIDKLKAKASVYLLFKSVIYDIDKILKDFLWNQSKSCNGKSKIAWNGPKDQGVWSLNHCELVKLKGKKCWEVIVDKSDSWSWKTMVKLRDKMKPFVTVKIGDGKSTSIWYDSWNWYDAIANVISKIDIYEARFCNNATVADMIKDGEWIWPKGYSVWNSMKVEYPKVEWHKIIWFSQCIPRHSFVMGMALHDKLRTQKRMAKWYTNDTLLCPLCATCNNSVHHFLFQSNFSSKVWSEVKSDLNLQVTPNDWQSIFQLMIKELCVNNIYGVLGRIGIAACVYYIWKERSFRVSSEC